MVLIIATICDALWAVSENIEVLLQGDESLTVGALERKAHRSIRKRTGREVIR